MSSLIVSLTIFVKIIYLFLFSSYQNTLVFYDVIYFFHFESQGDNLLAHLSHFCLLIIVFWLFSIRNKTKVIKIVSYFISIHIFLLCIFIFDNFENLSLSYIFIYKVYNFIGLNFNIVYTLGVDPISYMFLILTAILFPLCYMISWNTVYYNTNIII